MTPCGGDLRGWQRWREVGALLDREREWGREREIKAKEETEEEKRG